jgi:hypothetical protein
LILVGVVMISSCTSAQTYTSPKGYDLTKPVRFNMPDKLREISGIAFKNGNADMLFAEEDETGTVYYFRLGDKQISQSTFGKPGDYEDIAILGEQVIMLRSDGTLFTFSFKDVKNINANSVQKWKDILPQGEYEGMYANEKEQQLYVLCKHCSDDKTSKNSSGYIFKVSAGGQVKQSGTFSINIKQIEALLGNKKITFHPSALAKNQQTNEWYILSSVNKILVVADNNWNIKAVYPINPGLFLQPEGIAFDSQNNLYISNEGDKITPGNVLKFGYKP